MDGAKTAKPLRFIPCRSGIMIAEIKPISISLLNFLRTVSAFESLSEQKLETLAQQFQPLRYPIGRAILTAQKRPTQFSLIYQGQVRLLGYDPRTRTEIPLTLQLLEPGAAVGWVGLVRNHPCETAIAASDTICFNLPAQLFLQLIAQEPAVADYYQHQPSILEVFEVLGQQLLKS
jgi:ATP-binding cassette, subfamily B, bacterial HlyB/CyaB